MTELRYSTTGAGRFDASVIVEAQRASVRESEALIKAAGEDHVAATRANIHNKTRELGGGVRAKVKRTATGYVLRVGPSAGAFHGRFIEDGTGIRGPLAKVIPLSKRGVIRSGQTTGVPSGRGQAPQHPFSRARRAYDQGRSKILDRQIQDLFARAITAAIRKASQ